MTISEVATYPEMNLSVDKSYPRITPLSADESYPRIIPFSNEFYKKSNIDDMSLLKTQCTFFMSDISLIFQPNKENYNQLECERLHRFLKSSNHVCFIVSNFISSNFEEKPIKICFS